MHVKWTELLEAFEMASFGEPGTMEAYIERSSGKFFYYSEYVDEKEDDPAWIDAEDADPDRFITLPDKRELDLGKALALDFAATHLPEKYDEIDDIFRRRGAYSRFKAVLHHCGALEKWYAYETEATQKALREWAVENDIELIE